VQHLRDGEEIAVRANLTIKYEFIPRSDLPESACRADCLTPLVIEPGLCVSSREFGNIWRAVIGTMKGGFDFRMGIGLPNLYSEVPFTSFRGKTARIAFPDDPGMFQHIHPVGVRKCESNVLLAEQYRNRRCLA